MAKPEYASEDLKEIIAAAAKAASEAAIAAILADRKASVPAESKGNFSDAGPDEQFQAMVDARRARDKPAMPVTLVPAVSDRTGATFTAHVTGGIVRHLNDYAWPDGINRHVEEGGLVPQGLHMKDQTTGFETPHFKQWKWENYWQADLNAFIGRPLPKHCERPAQSVAA